LISFLKRDLGSSPGGKRRRQADEGKRKGGGVQKKEVSEFLVEGRFQKKNVKGGRSSGQKERSGRDTKNELKKKISKHKTWRKRRDEIRRKSMGRK